MSYNYQHLFFDLDHTLWDFERNSHLALEQLFDELELQAQTGSSFSDFIAEYRVQNEKMWKLYREGAIGKNELRSERFHCTLKKWEINDRELATEIDRQYLNLAPTLPHLIEGTIELLENLREDYQLHLITNGFIDATHTKITNSGLAPYFRLVMSSEELGVNKPDAAIFIESLKRTGAQRNNSLMIGDSLHSDILGARNCGIDQIYFNPEVEKHDYKVTCEVNHLAEIAHFLRPR